MREIRPLLDEAIVATTAERGFVILAGEELQFIAARSYDGTTLKAHPKGVSQTIIREVLASGEPRLAHDTGDDDTVIDGRVSVKLLGLRALLCAPLSWEGIVLGVLYLDSTDREVFHDEDLEVARGFAEKMAKTLS